MGQNRRLYRILLLLVLLPQVLTLLLSLLWNGPRPLPLLWGCLLLLLSGAWAFLVLRRQGKELERLTERAQRDFLTGLYNRGATEALVDHILSTSREPCCLLLLDIDDFKQVNDGMGHVFGDRSLQTLALRMRGAFGGEAILGRVGGDEFVAFLEGLPPDRLESCMSDLLAQISRRDGVTCTIGAAAAKPGDTFRQLYAAADRAMYAAKRAGKNRFCWAGSEDSLRSLP